MYVYGRGYIIVTQSYKFKCKKNYDYLVQVTPSYLANRELFVTHHLGYEVKQSMN